MFMVEIDQDQADKITIKNLTNTIEMFVDLIAMDNANPDEDTESENELRMKAIDSMNAMIVYFGGTPVPIS